MRLRRIEAKQRAEALLGLKPREKETELNNEITEAYQENSKVGPISTNPPALFRETIRSIPDRDKVCEIHLDYPRILPASTGMLPFPLLSSPLLSFHILTYECTG
jgi:hypothetical protein